MGSAGFIKYFKFFVEVFTAFIENAAVNFNCTPIHVLMLSVLMFAWHHLNAACVSAC